MGWGSCYLLQYIIQGPSASREVLSKAGKNCAAIGGLSVCLGCKLGCGDTWWFVTAEPDCI